MLYLHIQHYIITMKLEAYSKRYVHDATQRHSQYVYQTYRSVSTHTSHPLSRMSMLWWTSQRPCSNHLHHYHYQTNHFSCPSVRRHFHWGTDWPPCLWTPWPAWCTATGGARKQTGSRLRWLRIPILDPKIIKQKSELGTRNENLSLWVYQKVLINLNALAL